MKTNFIIYVTIIFGLLSFNLCAQEPNVEWGEIPKSDLEMTTYPSDTNATAVILYEYAESKLDDDLNIILSVHRRIKILNQSAFEKGTETLILSTDDGEERLYGVEGTTYSLNDNGEITKTEFNNDEVYEDEVIKGRTRYKFTMPALKPGCVIEYKYKIVSKYLSDISDWTFQKDEPVRWSEYKFQFPKNIAYAVVKRGYEPWAIDQVNEVTQTFSGSAAMLIGSDMPKCWEYVLAVKDIPALRDEPYITTINDYTNVVNIQLSGYAFANGYIRKFFTDWKALVDRLVDSDSFGDKIDVTGDVEDLANNITKGITNPLDKMKVIYNWVSNSIVWNGRNNINAEQDVDDIIEYKKGNIAEINFLLLSLLKSVGIEGDPVILSTRGNGQIQDLYPIVYQFNYVIAKVKVDSTDYLLDATDPLRPYNLLPSKILNTKGLVVQKDKVQWIPITSDKKNIDKAMTLIHVNKDGSIIGKLEDSYGEYNSLSNRKKLSDEKDIEVAKDLLNTESQGINIDSVIVSSKDSIQSPLNFITYISSDSYTQTNGELIYLNPYLVHRWKENPFKSKERKFAIDYGFKNGDLTVIDIYIPDGYELKEKIQNTKVMVGKFASYSRIAGVEGNMIQIINKMEIRSSLINQKYYSELKNFYARIVALQSEEIVLGPKSASTEKVKVQKSKDNKGSND